MTNTPRGTPSLSKRGPAALAPAGRVAAEAAMEDRRSAAPGWKSARIVARNSRSSLWPELHEGGRAADRWPANQPTAPRRAVRKRCLILGLHSLILLALLSACALNECGPATLPPTTQTPPIYPGAQHLNVVVRKTGSAGLRRLLGVAIQAGN